MYKYICIMYIYICVYIYLWRTVFFNVLAILIEGCCANAPKRASCESRLQLPQRHYLYFCTSKASKQSTGELARACCST